MLALKHLTKKFNDKKILDNISLEIPSGSIFVLLGSSGVGKSTLLRILNNLEKLDSGEVYLDGVLLDLEQINKNHLIGMVFQQFNLFDHLTVEENITLPLEKVLRQEPVIAKKTAHDLLTVYGLADKAKLNSNQLSGGQKQRLAIARSLALQPKVICLDEPTSALDPMLTNFVAQSIQELSNKGYTVLVATHDVAILERLNCTINLMKDGRIIEVAPSELFFQNRDSFPLIKQFVAGTV